MSDYITYKIGDVLENVTSSAVIAHGCNYSGGFGSGMAGAVAKKYPYVKTEFLKRYKRFHLGDVYFAPLPANLYIANMITQQSYGYDGKVYARPEYIHKALDKSIITCTVLNLPLHAVKIGCGLGGLNWGTCVKQIFEELTLKHKFHVTVWEL